VLHVGSTAELGVELDQGVAGTDSSSESDSEPESEADSVLDSESDSVSSSKLESTMYSRSDEGGVGSGLTYRLGVELIHGLWVRHRVGAPDSRYREGMS
jgi:hypothetical protein